MQIGAKGIKNLIVTIVLEKTIKKQKSKKTSFYSSLIKK
jgi:hypothetical protein